jgi:hypothetical protein
VLVWGGLVVLCCDLGRLCTVVVCAPNVVVCQCVFAVCLLGARCLKQTLLGARSTLMFVCL